MVSNPETGIKKNTRIRVEGSGQSHGGHQGAAGGGEAGTDGEIHSETADERRLRRPEGTFDNSPAFERRVSVRSP